MSVLKSILLTVAIFSIFASDNVKAQSSHSVGHSVLHRHLAFNRHVGLVKHHGGFVYGHQGYRISGYQMGGHRAGDLLRARAEANLTNAHASSQNEVVRTQRLNNDVLALQVRLERKNINKASRFGHLHARAAEIDQMRHSSTEPVESADELRRLRPEELDGQTGQLSWPLLLAMSHFEDARQPIDKVFAARAEVGVLHPDDYLPLLDLIDHVFNDLQANASIFPRQDLVEAQDFLRRMKSEARMTIRPTSFGAHFVGRNQ